MDSKRGEGERRESREIEEASVSIQLHSSRFIDSSWANNTGRAGQHWTAMTGHDWIRQLQQRRGNARRQDGTGWKVEGTGNSRALRLARLGPCTSDQPCKARLPALQLPVHSLPVPAREGHSQPGRPGNLAPSWPCRPAARGSSCSLLFLISGRLGAALPPPRARMSRLRALTRVSMRE